MNLLLRKKCIFVFLICLVFFSILAFDGNKVNASGIIKYDHYCIAKNKDVLFAPSSKADSSIKWESSNTDAVTVNEYGIIHAKNIGEAEITATESDDSISKCIVEVIGEDPIRIAYPSNSIVGINKNFEAIAITPKNVDSVKFEVNAPGGRFETFCSNKYSSGDVLVWTKRISIIREGTAQIKTYAKTNGHWDTRVEGDFNVKIIKSYNENSSSLQERSISKAGAEFIGFCEGFVNKVYKDPVNILTIGYGKVIKPYEQFYNNITHEEGVAVFFKMLGQGYYAKDLNDFLISNKIKFNQNQFDALVSFCYNLGSAWLKNGSDLSNILKNCSADSGGGSYVGKVNSDNGLNVRKDANTGSKRLCALRNGTVVTVLDDAKKVDNWYKIKTDDGTVGYCYGEYLNVTYLSGGFKRSLDNINKDEFIKEFSLYHHAGGKCLKGLILRRFRELDIFLRGIYAKLKNGNYNYPVPECAKDIMK